MPQGAAMTARGILGALLSIGIASICLPAGATEDPTADQQIQAVFSELRALRPMAAGLTYAVRVGGAVETGPKEQFLRRRTAQEIRESGLTCGCGDYARLFTARVVPLGYEALLVDGAEISSGSLRDHFSGHSVVAVRSAVAPKGAPWWLIDPTNMRLLERGWSPDARSFEAFDTAFWIGFCGPLSDYPVRSPEELRSFYSRTLAAVPREFMNENLCRLDFTVDRSLIGRDGEYLNPRLADFMLMQPRIFAAYGATPLRKVSILLVRGNEDSNTRLTYSSEGGWTARLGLKSGCSAGLLSYFEHTVRSQCGPVIY